MRTNEERVAELEAAGASDPGPSVPPRRLAGAVVWAGAAQGACEAARYLRLLVLARLLAPEDFGLFGVVLLFLGFLEAFTEPGLSTALLQRSGGVRRYLDSVFLVCSLRGLLLAAAIWIAAPAAASFWNVPEGVAVVRSASLVVLARGLVNPAMVLFLRELDFGTVFLWRLLEAGVSLAVAIALALAGYGVWALAGSLVAGEVTKTAVSYLLRPWRPSLRVDWQGLRGLVRFSRWVMVTNATVFLGLQLDSAVVAKVISPAALGFYQMAQRLAALPRVTFVAVLNQVALPALCGAQRDRRRLVRLLAIFWSASAIMAGAFGLAMALLAGPVVELALGPAWRPAAPLLSILCLSHVLRSIAVVPSSYFYAIGRPWVTFYMNASRAAGLALALWPLMSAADATGAAWASVVGAAAMTVTWIIGMLRDGRRSGRDGFPAEAAPRVLAEPEA